MDYLFIAPIACLAITATSAVIITLQDKAKQSLKRRADDLSAQLEISRKTYNVHAADLDKKIAYLRIEVDALRARLKEVKRVTSGAMLRDPKTGKMSGRADW